MTITVYGIKSCNSMKKTFTKLDDMNVPYVFHDYKKQGIDKASVQRWVDALGIDKVLNKRGTTWRKLTDDQKQAANDSIDTAIELMVENTSMIKRPIVEGKLNSPNSSNIKANPDYNDNSASKANNANKDVLLCGFDEEAFESLLKN